MKHLGYGKHGSKQIDEQTKIPPNLIIGGTENYGAKQLAKTTSAKSVNSVVRKLHAEKQMAKETCKTKTNGRSFVKIP